LSTNTLTTSRTDLFGRPFPGSKNGAKRFSSTSGSAAVRYWCAQLRSSRARFAASIPTSTLNKDR